MCMVTYLIPNYFDSILGYSMCSYIASILILFISLPKALKFLPTCKFDGTIIVAIYTYYSDMIIIPHSAQGW